MKFSIMKQSTDRPHIDKKNETLIEGEELSSKDKNPLLSDEDISRIPDETGSVQNSQSDNHRALTDDDPDDETKVGLDSPWNIFS